MQRQASIYKSLEASKISGLLITNPTNIFYLTGFKGVSPTEREALLIIRKPKNILITAKLYQAEAKKIASLNLSVKIAAERNEYETFIKESFKGIKKLGFESRDLKYLEFQKFKKYAKHSKFIATKNIIENLRLTKSEAEIQTITKAQLITQSAFGQIIKTIKIGQTETEISDKLIAAMKSLGAQGPSFDPIVASGPNSALPHHVTSNRKIKKGDTLLFDFGAKFKNYCADFSRAVFVGKANNTQRKTYDLVFKSQQTAIAKLKAGIAAKSVHAESLIVFKSEKVENNYIHSLGHGIGLDVHEKPSLSAKSKDKLTEGMVFSVEPGLYFPWGGVRIEDLAVMGKNSAKLIGTSSSFIELKV